MATFNAGATPRVEQSKGSGIIDVSVVPSGRYPVEIVKVDSYQKPDDPSRYPEVREPAKRRISIVTVYYEVTAGENKGEVIKQYLSMNHPSEKAMEISHSKMAWICESTGVKGFRDHEIGPFDMLLKKELIVRVEEMNGRNEFWEFLPRDAQAVTTQGGFAIAGNGDKRPAGRDRDW